MTEGVTAHDLALLRLVAQRLVGPPLGSPRAVVEHLAALQAQDGPGALRSVALRCDGTPDEVRAAFDAGTLVRSWPMRGTLHVLLAEDLPWMLPLMTPRPRAAAAKRRPELGLGEADVARARALAEEALAGTALTRRELLAGWDAAGLATAGGRGYHLVVELAQRGVLCLGPHVGEEQAFVLVAEHAGTRARGDVGGRPRDEALAELALRYFRGHGPATLADLARWAGLPMADVRAGTTAVRAQLAAVEVDGVEHLLAPETLDAYPGLRAAAEGSVLLLPGFDELVLGYRDRSMTLAAEHADRVVPGGNGVFRPTVVAGGRVVAVWRTVGTGRNRRLEVEPFEEPLAAATLAAAEERWARLG